MSKLRAYAQVLVKIIVFVSSFFWYQLYQISLQVLILVQRVFHEKHLDKEKLTRVCLVLGIHW